MSRILAYTSPGRGHLFPIAPVLLALKMRGHDVRLRTLGDACAAMRALGFVAQPIDDAISEIAIDDWTAKTPNEAQELAMQAFARRAPLDGADLKAAIAEEKPDVVVIDIMSFGALAQAEASGLPWASWLPYPAWLRAPGIPPYGPGLPPMTGEAGRARDEAVARAVEGPARNLTAAVNAGRASAGLTAIAAPDDVLLRPPLLLYMTAEPFEYPRASWPASFLLTGPCNWEPPSELPLWLAREERAIVLVSTSTEFQDDGRLVDSAIKALSDREDLLIVANAPREGTNANQFRNARIERFVPHAHVLPRAALVICHAGMGITQKALSAGVPVCAVPFGRDQFEVARRVEVAGAGVQLPAYELTVQGLRDAAKRALACRAGAKRIAEAFSKAGGPPAAARAIEQLATR